MPKYHQDAINEARGWSGAPLPNDYTGVEKNEEIRQSILVNPSGISGGIGRSDVGGNLVFSPESNRLIPNRALHLHILLHRISGVSIRVLFDTSTILSPVGFPLHFWLPKRIPQWAIRT